MRRYCSCVARDGKGCVLFGGCGRVKGFNHSVEKRSAEADRLAEYHVESVQMQIETRKRQRAWTLVRLNRDGGQIGWNPHFLLARLSLFVIDHSLGPLVRHCHFADKKLHGQNIFHHRPSFVLPGFANTNYSLRPLHPFLRCDCQI
jgi:hypothetical protein